MQTFDEFWNENKKDYLDYIKKVAMADFKAISENSMGKYVAHIEIDTDDDFYFENGNSFKVYGNSKKELIQNSISFLANLQIVSGSQSKWEWLRDESINRLNSKNTNFQFGGNQTIDFSTFQTKEINQLSFKKSI